MNGELKTDALTGLADHDSFRAWVAGMLTDDSRVGISDPMTLVYFNVENFKLYNEHYGFEAGNELLLLVTNAIRKAYDGCVAARFSADQFMVAVAQSQVADGIARVRSAFRTHHKDSSISLKAGYYVTKPDDTDAGVVCDRAKMACDAIKGRRDVFFREYDMKLQHQIQLHRYVLNHFDDALENGWIKIYYQPIVRVATGEVCDEEALARWVDPVEGILAPVEFIPVLEEARLIHRLDLYMVRRACENYAKLKEYGIEIIPVSVNLSRLDFELCDIVEEVKAILDEYDVSYDMITIEITESALAGNEEFLRGEVDRFRLAGFEVWIDDFGAGYSSLGTLKAYDFDLVKIDMTFLENFDNDRRARIMLAHIISMAKELGLKTLVEGVETSEQYAFLRNIGCGRAQGFLLGRPASLADSEKAISSRLYPQMERMFKRSFYEDVGRVNLIRPNPSELPGEDYVPSDAATAIVRRNNGRYEYLNTNEMYVKFLKDVGLGTVEDSERVINEPGNHRRASFVQTADACVEAGDWVEYPVTIGEHTLSVRMHCISRVPDSDIAAILVIVE